MVVALYLSKNLEVSTLEDLFSTMEFHESRCARMVGEENARTRTYPNMATNKD